MRWMRGTIGIVGAVLLAGVLGGCGYALVGRASSIPEDVRAVYLAPFLNLTDRLEIEQFLTQAIADELVVRRRFTIVNSSTEADAVLQGRVRQFRVTPITFTDDGRGREYEISIIADVDFNRSGQDGETLWSAANYQFRQSYELDLDQVAFTDQENTALEEASLAFAKTMVSDLLEGF